MKEPACFNDECEHYKIKVNPATELVIYGRKNNIDNSVYAKKTFMRKIHFHKKQTIPMYILLCEDCSKDNTVAKRILGVKNES